MNQCMFIGNLGRDPETKTTQASQFTRFTIAVNDKFVTKSGERRERTSWIPVIAWGHLSEIVCHTIKGDKVFVLGEYQSSSWVDSHGTKRFGHDIVASQIVVLVAHQGGGSSGPRTRDNATVDQWDPGSDEDPEDNDIPF